MQTLFGFFAKLSNFPLFSPIYPQNQYSRCIFFQQSFDRQKRKKK